MSHLSSLDLGVARELDRLAKQMDVAGSFNYLVKARLNFIVRVVQLRVTCRLNSLGQLNPVFGLSERSLDRVFEDGEVSDEVVLQLVAHADRDQDFRFSLLQEFGAECLASWRLSQRQGKLL